MAESCLDSLDTLRLLLFLDRDKKKWQSNIGSKRTIKFLLSKEREEIMHLSLEMAKLDNIQDPGEYLSALSSNGNGRHTFHKELRRVVTDRMGVPKSKDAAAEAKKEVEKADLLKYIDDRIEALYPEEDSEKTTFVEEETGSYEEETSEEA